MRAQTLTMEGDSPAAADRSPAPAAGAPEDLLRRARAGDALAFDLLMRRHDLQVLRTARRLVVHAADAQDAAQEVFVRLYRSLGRIDPRRPLAAWLYRVTVNVCHDLNRARLRFRALPVDDLPAAEQPVAADAASDPAARAERAQEDDLLRRFLAELPEKERAAVVLRDLEGLSTREVARIQRSTATTVRSQISRARLKLRRVYARYLEEGPDAL